MTLSELLAQLRLNRDFISQVVAWERFPPRPARFGEVTAVLDPRILAALQTRGVGQFFTHQAAAIEAALNSQDVIIATATASGKSLCYTVPVLQRLLDRPVCPRPLSLPHQSAGPGPTGRDGGRSSARASCPSPPTPTMATRRKAAGRRCAESWGHPHQQSRHAPRRACCPITPPGATCFANLQFIVLDEIHTYRGVFGSHVANVLRRLLRICDFYGSAAPS
jgi:DEAD/DEAH box helicase domain-containing protein